MSRAARSDLTDVEVHLHHETYPGEDNLGAYKVSLTGEADDAVWIPKSAAQFERKARRVGVLTLSEELATTKGLV
jgi:hypothetical protein